MNNINRTAFTGGIWYYSEFDFSGGYSYLHLGDPTISPCIRYNINHDLWDIKGCVCSKYSIIKYSRQVNSKELKFITENVDIWRGARLNIDYKFLIQELKKL